jgi:hypothetical protein
MCVCIHTCAPNNRFSAAYLAEILLETGMPFPRQSSCRDASILRVGTR